MAVPTLSNVWCAQFGEADDYWLSSAGTFYQMSAPYQCEKRWVVVTPEQFNMLVEGYGGHSDFYAMSAELFGLQLCAVAVVWAVKHIAFKAIFAS